MKRILIALLLIATTIDSNGQSLATQIANFRATNNTTITTKTAPGSVTPVNVGGNIDSVARYLDSLLGYISSAGNLQAVTDAGNTTTNTIVTNGGAFFAEDPVYAGYISVAARNIEFQSTGTPNATLSVGGLTANRGYLLPDEGTGSGTASTIVLHTTKDAINVVGGGNTTTMNPNAFEVTDGSSEFIAQATYSQVSSPIVAGNGTVLINLSDRLRYKQLSGAGFATADIVVPVTLSSNHVYNLPDYSGNVLLNYGGNISASLTTARTLVVTHGAPFTPTRVTITPRDGGGAAAWQGGYISAITGTTFTITFLSPVTGTVTYDYQLFP